MTWRIAQAKQNLSKVIRAAAKEPQVILNRDRPVAVVIGEETFAEFESWRHEVEKRQTLAESLAELRTICAEEDYEFPEIVRENRPNPFADRLAEDV